MRHNNGGRAYTLQNIGFAHFLDARGVTQMATSRNHGGFRNERTNQCRAAICRLPKLGLRLQVASIDRQINIAYFSAMEPD